MAKLSTIYDPFDGDGLNTELWNDSSGATQVSGDGYATVPASGTYSNFLGFTPPSRDFAEDSFTWEWTFPSATAAGAEQYCVIGNGISGEEFQFGRFSTSLGYFVGAEDGFETWDDTNHRWCRIRTTATQVLLETSADGETWTNPFVFGGGGVLALPAWDISTVHVHFVNGFFTGAGAGDMRIHTVGVDSSTLSGSLAAALGGASAGLDATLTYDASMAGALGAAQAASTGRVVSRTSLGGVLGGLTAAADGMFESSAEDVTLSVGPTRIATTGIGTIRLSPSVAATIVERSP